MTPQDSIEMEKLKENLQKKYIKPWQSYANPTIADMYKSISNFISNVKFSKPLQFTLKQAFVNRDKVVDKNTESLVINLKFGGVIVASVYGFRRKK